MSEGRQGCRIGLVGLFQVSKGRRLSPVHGGLSMDGFKLACIFAKTKFVRYVPIIYTV